ncbi:MAG: hypothetical protein ACLP7P_16305 [Rhodomicrobium sp.]
MTHERSGEERPPAKFPNVTRNDWLHALPDPVKEIETPPHTEEQSVPLAGLIEQVMRDGSLKAAAPFSPLAASPAPVPGNSAKAVAEALPEKLIEELRAAQEQLQAEPAPALAGKTKEPDCDAPPSVEILAQPASESADKVFAESGIAAMGGGAASKRSATNRIQRALGGAGAAMAKRSEAGIHYARQFSRRMRLRDWQRRYLTVLSLIHCHVFDRGIERLLFIKTPVPETRVQTEAGGQKSFQYRGPIPGKVLEWALSALPGDLKRYAFADFRAGNGRTLLLAARRNFEYATGYAFDTESCEVLELNLAQYSRSYMSCRDVRALRGDRDGISIPSQPAVLFFPDSLTSNHLSIILDHVAASQELAPRPVYLIFENSGREQGLDQMQIFERLPLSFLNRVKTYLFSPAKIAVYKSLNNGGVD